jgi:hypothetical protein
MGFKATNFFYQSFSLQNQSQGIDFEGKHLNFGWITLKILIAFS